MERHLNHSIKHTKHKNAWICTRRYTRGLMRSPTPCAKPITPVATRVPRRHSCIIEPRPDEVTEVTSGSWRSRGSGALRPFALNTCGAKRRGGATTTAIRIAAPQQQQQFKSPVAAEVSRAPARARRVETSAIREGRRGATAGRAGL